MASTYLSKSASAGNRKTYTFSAWVKRSGLSVAGVSGDRIFSGYVDGSNWTTLFFGADDRLVLYHWSSGTPYVAPSRLFRDVSAWYHIVLAVDTTQATASDRLKFYVNGVQETSFNASTYPTLNQDTNINASGSTFYVGQDPNDDFNGLMAHVHFIDGIAYDASAFGETDATTGIWKPKTAPSVTYGTNGFFLKFENSGAFGTDSSGNANNFTVNGTMTQTIDTPSNVFATFNPLIYNPAQANYNPLFSNGNTTTASNTSVNAFSNARATLAMLSGKYYAEFKITSSDANMDLGLINYQSGFRTTNNWGLYYQDDGAVAFRADGSIKINFVTSGTTFGGYTSGDILQVAFDRTSKKVWLGKNGTWFNSGDPSNGTNELLNLSATIGDDEFWTFAVGLYHSVSEVWNANFGNGYFGTTPVASAQNPDDGVGIFEYDVPTGYKSLCTKSINAQEYS